MERKIEIPNFRDDDDATIEDVESVVSKPLSSEASKDWEKIGEDWVSLFLDPAMLDDHSRSVPLDFENYLQFNSTLQETNDYFSFQDLLADSVLLHSINDQLFHNNMVFRSSLNVVEDIFEKENSSLQVDLIDSKNEPLRHGISTSPANNWTKVSEESSSKMKADLWKDKEANPNLTIMLKWKMNNEILSNSETPTSPLNVAIGKESVFTNNASPPDNSLQSSFFLLQCEEGKIESKHVGGEVVPCLDSIALVSTPSSVSQSKNFGVKHLQNIGNSIKVGLLGRSRNMGSTTEDRKNCKPKSFKFQNQEIFIDQRSNHCNNDRKEGGGDEDNEKKQAWLMDNCESIQLSLQRKVYVDEFEDKLQTIDTIVAELNATIIQLTTENVNLQRQLRYYFLASGACPKLRMPMHIMPIRLNLEMVSRRPIHPSGQMSPLPIPKTKTQISAHNSKRLKFRIPKEEGEKRQPKLKTASVASVAIVGLLCVAVLFSSLDQGFNGSNRIGDYTREKNVQIEGCILTSSNEGVNSFNITRLSSWDFGVGWQPPEQGEYDPKHERVSSVHTQLGAKNLQYKNEKLQEITKVGFQSSIQHSIDRNETIATSTSFDYFNFVNAPLLLKSNVIPTNTSQLFVASMFVLEAKIIVKVDENLIIQVAMAGDKIAKKYSEKKRKSRLKKKIERKKSTRVSSQLQTSVKSHKVKALNTLASRESKVLENITTRLFVTSRPLSRNAHSIVKANNPVLPMLLMGYLQQWMFGDHYEPIICKRNISDNVKEALPLLIGNEERFETLMPFWAAIYPLACNQLLQKNTQKKNTCSVPTLNKLFWAATKSLPAKAESQQCIATDCPVLNTSIYMELFQFDKTTNILQGQASIFEAKNMAKSMAAKVAHGNLQNKTSTLYALIYPCSHRNPFVVAHMKLKPLVDMPKKDFNGTDPIVKKTAQEQMHNQILRYGVSRIMVSVMTDREEYKDGRKKGTKELFTVILIENHIFVMYSCMLPFDRPPTHVIEE